MVGRALQEQRPEVLRGALRIGRSLFQAMSEGAKLQVAELAARIEVGLEVDPGMTVGVAEGVEEARATAEAERRGGRLDG